MKNKVNLINIIDDWKNFKKAFLTLNYMVKPKDLVNLELCNLAEKRVSSLENDFSKVL